MAAFNGMMSAHENFWLDDGDDARFLAERIGMNQSLLAQYTSGIKKPSEKQLKRILNGIHSVGKELSDISLILK